MNAEKLTIRMGVCRAIFTKYIGPTNIRGSRVKAYDQEGNSVTIGYDNSLHRDEIHAVAARKLCEKMEWNGELVSGGTKEGNVFVFTEHALPANSVLLQCDNVGDAQSAYKILARQCGNKEEQTIRALDAGLFRSVVQRSISVSIG